MIEEKFFTKNGLVIDNKIVSIRDRVAEILEVNRGEVYVNVLKPPISGATQTTYSIRVNKTSVSIWYDTDSIKVQRKGLMVQVAAPTAEDEIYQAIVKIFGEDIYK